MAPDLSWSPTFRTVFALRKLTAIPDAQWANPRVDWEDACEQLGGMFGDLPLCESRQKWLQSFQNIEGSILSGDFGQGVASAHLTWLLECAKAGIGLRESEIKWIDKVGWPNQEEPLTIGPEADPPPDARTAWSRLRRLRRQIRMDISGESVVKLANSLFEP
ncbi:hypothetical protein [Streptomyces sp. NPDC052012]|uniref:hypothetical protein n=1 Tax=Streptomyces sp. NPDC052012 TaxID=3155051 RepID=UPI0034502624